MALKEPSWLFRIGKAEVASLRTANTLVLPYSIIQRFPKATAISKKSCLSRWF
jgi:hypothetical protein